MLILNLESLVRAARRHPQARNWLTGWRSTVETACWRHLQDVREHFPHADAVKLKDGIVVTIFNVGGNDYRLLTTIAYARGRIFIHDLLTHAEYSKDAWKKRL